MDLSSVAVMLVFADEGAIIRVLGDLVVLLTYFYSGVKFSSFTIILESASVITRKRRGEMRDGAALGDARGEREAWWKINQHNNYDNCILLPRFEKSTLFS